MPRKIFVNLPVADLKKSIDFFTKLGFTFNPQFTDDTATCMIISDDIYAMLLTHAKFSQFVKQPISDARRQTEVLLALSFDSRAEVDALVDKALAGGAQPAGEPQDHGFMYSRSFHDLDGHIWEPFWMDPAMVK
jgi:predicted lactoylglutathione lyase